MEKAIKKFRCTTKTKYTKTISTFTAFIKPSYDKIFRLKVQKIQYENGTIKCRSISYLYFKTIEELEKEMQYHYILCKNNLFTKKIEIIK